MKKINTRGIRFKTLIYIFIFSIIILGALWLLQVVFLKSYYQSMKKREIEKLGEAIVDNYATEDEAYSQYILDEAFKNNIIVLAFTVNGNFIEILYSGGLTGEDMTPQFKQTIINLIGELEDSDVSSFIEDERAGYETLIYGQKKNINGETIYFYVNSSLVPVESTTAVLTNQLIIITIICLGLSLIISFIISKNLSKPIIEITKGAEKLAGGDLSVKFDYQGYNEIEKLCETLNYATSELLKTDNLRKDLISNVSHELRTPLTMIKAYTELIRDISGNNIDKRQEHLQVILDEADRLTHLVNDILDLSKLQSGVVNYDKTEFNISKTIEKTANNFIGIYEKQGFNFTLHILPDVFIFADESKIEQVLYNLISNAINYSTDNKNITISLQIEGNNNRLDIIDSGIGISPEDLPQVFDKFFMTGEGKRAKIGSGIGLSIVKSILTGHGFQYGVTSELGKGSDFYVIFSDTSLNDGKLFSFTE